MLNFAGKSTLQLYGKRIKGAAPQSTGVRSAYLRVGVGSTQITILKLSVLRMGCTAHPLSHKTGSTLVYEVKRRISAKIGNNASIIAAAQARGTSEFEPERARKQMQK